MKKKTQSSYNSKVLVGVAACLAALTTAGYFTLDPNGKKNRKAIKGWTLTMKGEVLQRLEKMKKISPEIYEAVIDEVSAKYGKLKHLSGEELTDLTTDLKKHWKAISHDLATQEKAAKKKVISTKKRVTTKAKAVQKTVKKAAKKVVQEVKNKVKEGKLQPFV